MLLFPLAALVGIAAGFLAGGRLAGLAGLRFRAPPVLFGALAVQVALGLPPLEHLAEGGSVALVFLSYGVVGGWLAVNASAYTGALRSGLLLLAAGWVLNLVAIVPNGGMPVSRVALDQVGAPADMVVEDGNLEKHVAADEGTRLAWLGDVIPVALFGAVISVGDVVMLVGVAVVVAAGMQAGGRAARRDIGEHRPGARVR